MAKAWTNNRWNIEWKGQQTGYYYKLVIRPSDTTAMTPVDVDLPDDCLADFEYSWEYDKYPVGMPAAPSLDLTFRIDKCTAEFAKALINDPFADHTVNLESYYSFDITCGNVFELWISYNGGVSFNKVFIGVQQVGKENAFSYDDMTVKIEVIEIGYFTLSNIPTEALDYVLMNNDSLVHQSKGYLDYWYLANQSYMRTGTYSPRHAFNFWYFPTYLLFYHLDYIASLISNRLYRVDWDWDTVDYSFYNLTNAYNLLDCYYRQNYTGDGSIGTKIDYDEIYSLIYFTDKTVTTDWPGAMAQQTSNTGSGVLGLPYILKKEYQSCWDLMREITTEHLKYAYTTYDVSSTPATVARYTTRNIYTTDYIDISDKILLDIELESYDVLQAADAVSVDKVEDTPDKITASNKKAKNDKSYSVNVILQNVPFAGKMDVKANDPSLPSRHTSVRRVNNTEQFYIDTSVIVAGKNYANPDSIDVVRVHERCNFQLSSTTKSDDIITIPDIDLVDPASNNPYTPNILWPPDYDPKTKEGSGTGNISRQLVGQVSGKLRCIAETLLDLFGGKYQRLLKARCRINDLATSATTNNTFEPTHELYYDLDLISPHAGMLDSIERRFTLLSVKLSKKEFVEFEAISRAL